jgi:hypothetical protein
MRDQTKLPWYDQLTDSVFALGEAAREYRHAYRAAVVTRNGVELDRRLPRDGEIATVNPFSAGRRPHDTALFTLGDLYLQHQHQVARLYEEAAMLYASGAAWAVRELQEGRRPQRAVFAVDEGGGLVPGGLRIEGLDGFTVAGPLAAAYEALTNKLAAEEYGADIASQRHINDHEEAEMEAAWHVAEGIADAAYAYGVQAERAVHCALLGPKAEYARERAAGQAAAEAAARQSAAGEAGGGGA